MKKTFRKFTVSLWKLTGEDYLIISRSKSMILRLYYSLMGLFVLLILLSCFISAIYFTDHLFHNKFLDIGVGLVWGYIITNMYVLMLYTITPPLLPVKEKKFKLFTHFQSSISFSIRVSIIALMAVIMAQPLVIFFLKPESTQFAMDIKNLNANEPRAQLIATVVLLIFLLPIPLKYSIRWNKDFYKLKKKMRRQFVIKNYQTFKTQYEKILSQNISRYNKEAWNNLFPYLNKLESIDQESYRRHFKEISKELADVPVKRYEYWDDNPFRTRKRIITTNVNSEKDLLNLIYSEDN